MVFIKHFLAYLLTFVVRLVPRKRNLIIYGGAADRFLDNAKYCFIDGSKHISGFEHVWLTRNSDVFHKLNSNGYKCVRSNSSRGVWMAIRARYYIFDSNIGDFTLSFLASGAVTVNLWHGIPFKKIGYDNMLSMYSAFGRNMFEKILNKPSTSPDWVLSTSASIADIFARSFRLDEKQVVIGGYYRTLPFSWTSQELIAFIQDWDNSGLQDLLQLILQHPNSRFVVYMPTFRDTGEDFISRAFPDLKTLNRWCLEHDFFFLFKTHRATIGTVRLGNTERLIWMENDVDIYPLLPFTHLLITDYSSVFFDYALLNKPVLFYPFDLDEYRLSCRGFNFDYTEMIGSSPCVLDFEGLLKMLGQWRNFPKRQVAFFDQPYNYQEVFKVLQVENRKRK